MNEAKCVLWAVDPWEKSETPSMSEVRRLARAARREGLPLIPVHVVSVSEPQWERGKVALIPEIQAELELYLRRFSISHAEPRVIVDESGNRAGAVRALLDLAKQEKAAWIMVSSHGKTGMARLMLGSFAENLVKHSRLPLFFLPRQALRPTTRASRVALFPTDLSPAAHVAFTRFLDVALSQRLEIAILHELSTPIPSFDAGLGPVFPQNFDGEQKQWAQKAGAALVEEARRHGVKARFALDSGVTVITGEAVLAAARREKARMIAMPSMSGPWMRLVAGSVAEKVFRSGRVPVCLYGPEAIGPQAGTAA